MLCRQVVSGNVGLASLEYQSTGRLARDMKTGKRRDMRRDRGRKQASTGVGIQGLMAPNLSLEKGELVVKVRLLQCQFVLDMMGLCLCLGLDNVDVSSC